MAGLLRCLILASEVRNRRTKRDSFFARLIRKHPQPLSEPPVKFTVSHESFLVSQLGEDGASPPSFATLRPVAKPPPCPPHGGTSSLDAHASRMMCRFWCHRKSTASLPYWRDGFHRKTFASEDFVSRTLSVVGQMSLALANGEYRSAK